MDPIGRFGLFKKFCFFDAAGCRSKTLLRSNDDDDENDDDGVEVKIGAAEPKRLRFDLLSVDVLSNDV